MANAAVKQRRLNEWYAHTYNTVLNMARWSSFASDIEKKLVCVFSWMPQGIMHVKDNDEMLKADLYAPADLVASLTRVRKQFNAIRGLELLDVEINDITAHVEAIWAPLYKMLGASAASKYLHFSSPKLLPMSDRRIRKYYCGQSKIDDYILYMSRFQLDLRNKRMQRKARDACSVNLVRGLDIVNMRGDLPPKGGR